MRKLFLLPFMLPLICFSQTQESIIASSVCKKISRLDLSEPPNILNQKASITMQDEYQKYKPEILDLLEVYRQKNSELSDQERMKLIAQQISIHLMDKCVPYQRITMFQSKPVPKISETTKKIGDEYSNLLRSRSKSQKLTQIIIGECIIEVTDKYADLVEKKYGDRYSEEFIKEFQAYIMTESIPHIKWLASQIK